LKLPEGHKFPTAQELQGRPYYKWHHLFTHNTNGCKELRRQIQSAIEQGRLILGQFTMKVDTRPFLGVNMMEGHRDSGEQSAWCRLDFSFGVNMAGSLRHHDEEKGASLRDRPRKGEKKYITEEQVRHVQYQRSLSAHLLKKYEYQYRQRHQYESKDEEYEHHIGKSLKKREDSHDHWHCPFFKHCWNVTPTFYKNKILST
jgi:acyl-CoA thioesterase